MTQDGESLSVEEATGLRLALHDDDDTADPMARHLDRVRRDAEQALKARGLIQDYPGSASPGGHPNLRVRP